MRGETHCCFSHLVSCIKIFMVLGSPNPAQVKMIVQYYVYWIHLYLVPGLLVQVYALVQWGSLYQLHD